MLIKSILLSTKIFTPVFHKNKNSGQFESKQTTWCPEFIPSWSHVKFNLSQSSTTIPGILSHMNGSLISFIHCLIYLDGLNDGPRNLIHNFLKNKAEIIYFEDKVKSQSKCCISKIVRTEWVQWWVDLGPFFF